jgi:hypothetical protein
MQASQLIPDQTAPSPPLPSLHQAPRQTKGIPTDPHANTAESKQAQHLSSKTRRLEDGPTTSPPAVMSPLSPRTRPKTKNPAPSLRRCERKRVAIWIPARRRGVKLYSV